MKKLKLIAVLVSISLLTITCKKEHGPISTTANPIFYFNGLVGNNHTEINAGVNNYYMYSSYVQDTNHVYNFIGDLKQINSNLNTLEIRINDYKISAVNSN